MDQGPTSEARKLAHLELTLEAQVDSKLRDKRFNYEPLFESHPTAGSGPKEINFLNKKMNAPLWISSMTGGTGPARHINQNLARAVGEFGLGMGLGSCRSLLTDNKFFEDFNLRELVGNQPFYTNLGIAQVEQAFASGTWDQIEKMVSSLRADGLIIHLNPMQEWFQEEGDLLLKSPLETIDKAIDKKSFPLIIKEVGQGMGPKSLEALMKRDLEAIEFGAFGGTNFSKLEQLRSNQIKSNFSEMALVGHTAEEMVEFVNHIISENNEAIKCKQFIISGGIKSALQGLYLTKTCQGVSVYGQAKAMLMAAGGSYKDFHKFIESQIEGLVMAEKYLTPVSKGLQ